MKQNKRAFTLIELLVIVLIIGILAAVALPQYRKAVYKSRSIEALTLIRGVVPAVREYILANGEFPTTFDDMSILPAGELQKYSKNHDMIQAEHSSVILTRGRIDAGPEPDDENISRFIYPTEYSTLFTYLEPNHIYCYYMTNDTTTMRKDICSSLGVQVENNGKLYRFFKID